jgi:hypothetical protein
MAQQERVTPQAARQRAFEFPQITQDEQHTLRKVYHGTVLGGITPHLSAFQVELSPSGKCRNVTVFQSIPDGETEQKGVWKKSISKLYKQQGAWSTKNSEAKEQRLQIGIESTTGKRLDTIISATQAYHDEWRAAATDLPFAEWRQVRVEEEIRAELTEQTDQVINPRVGYISPEQLVIPDLQPGESMVADSA